MSDLSQERNFIMADAGKKPESLDAWLSRNPCRDGHCKIGKEMKPEDWIHSECCKKPCAIHLNWCGEMPHKGIVIGS